MPNQQKSKPIASLGLGLFVVLDLALILIAVAMLLRPDAQLPAGTAVMSSVTTSATTTTTTTTNPYPQVSYAEKTTDTVALTVAEMLCSHAILVDCQSNEILAERSCGERIYPASMTKVMTLIVALESDCEMTDTFTMTADIIAPLLEAHASRAGFLPDEVIPFRDLLYGTALPSGADATTALACMIAGSEDQFVNLMNMKAREIGMENTHFMNASGLHDENHYSTMEDIALMMAYAVQVDACREILSTKEYTTAPTPQNPEGLELQNTMFMRMYGNEAEGVEILGGKTGYTDAALNCLASFAEKDGKLYIAVCAGGVGKWHAVYDTITLYDNFIDYTIGDPITPFTGLK